MQGTSINSIKLVGKGRLLRCVTSRRSLCTNLCLYVRTNLSLVPYASLRLSQSQYQRIYYTTSTKCWLIDISVAYYADLRYDSLKGPSPNPDSLLSLIIDVFCSGYYVC